MITRPFHISHNTVCLLPKICISIVLNFSWDVQSSQEKLKTMVMQNIGGQSKGIMGDVEVVNEGFYFFANSSRQLLTVPTVLRGKLPRT